MIFLLVNVKVDLSSGNPTRLLEVTRRLTEGIVNGRSSHLDVYENRFNHRVLLASKENAMPRLSIEELLYHRLPLIAHEAASRRLEHLKKLRTLLGAPQSLMEKPVEVIRSPPSTSLLIDSKESQTQCVNEPTPECTSTHPDSHAPQMEDDVELRPSVNSEDLSICKQNPY